MKNLIAFSVLAFSISSVSAVDVSGSVSVSADGKQVFQSANTFIGLTDEQAATLKTRATKQLDIASKCQDKGGDFSMAFKWNADPAVETGGMRMNCVNRVLRQGMKFLDDTLRDVEGRDAKGKKRPFGQ